MLEEVGGAVGAVGLGTGTGVNPDTDGSGLSRGLDSVATVRPLERVVVWVMGWRETAVARLRKLKVAAVAGTLLALASLKEDCAKRRAAMMTRG